MQIITLKLILTVIFFLQVIIFGKCVSNLECFQSGKMMSIAMTFSGSLFLSISLIDMIPHAISDFKMYFIQIKQPVGSKSSIHPSGDIPIAMIIVVLTYMGIMFIDKVLIAQNHNKNHNQFELNFDIQEKDNKQVRLEQFKQNTNINANFQQMNKQSSNQSSQFNENYVINWKPIVLQLGMSIHAFFQNLAVGIQKDTLSVLGIGIAILIHKWAQGLTLGLIYKKAKFSNIAITWMMLLQGLVNIIGMLAGIILYGYGNLVMGIFMSLSAGTFLYISTAEVLLEQIKQFGIQKMIAMIVAISFVSALVLCSRQQM